MNTKKKKKIPQEFIHEIIEKTNIIEIINRYITLKKTGNNYKTLCPFHYEKTPSFTVNSEKQFFYCFGCGIHGNVIDFLMQYEKLDFLSSINELTSLHGIKIPYIQYNSQFKKKFFYKKKIYKILKKTSKIYIKNLFKVPNQAYNYLIKRGITSKIMKNFSLGYALSNNYQITNFIKKKTTNISTIIDCGLSIYEKNKIKQDRFKERIIFPIKNKYGIIKGFGGRIINQYNYPKYLNSPETITFFKKKNLYGIYELILKNPKPKKILVVEGYFDVISLAQKNINYSIALLGTNITTYQIKKIFQISKKIIFCFDGDKAGRIASWKSLNLILPFLYDEYIINFLLLPKNEDPSSLIIKEGKKKFEKRIKKSESFYSFFFKKVTNKINLSCINDCIKLSRITIPLIKKIPSKIIKIYLRKILGNKIGILDSYQLKKLIQFQKEKKKKINKPVKITTMRLLISLIIQYPKLVKKIKNIKKIKKLHIQGKKILIKLIELIKKKKIFKTGYLLEFFRFSKLGKIFKYLSTWNHIILKKKIFFTFKEFLNNFKQQHLEYKYNKLITIERKKGFDVNEKKKIWNISKKLIYIKNIKFN
ncbi:DNA primase [Buchnera aphidicola]|uniref:DNA primase n=1 Tax=Buchnera aphidicola subsp. Cinara cedri (strain Cc) TaxID=372461 RepID=Q058D3_BUCCC|nr:DNA primase [Buchnera aphidicola]ABJ90516.1 DNA primase [Buchnera aphidicola BCc]